MTVSRSFATVVATIDARAVGSSGISSAHDPVVPKSFGEDELEDLMQGRARTGVLQE